MGEACFYLKKTDKGKRALIYLQFRYHGNKLVYAFGQTIDPKNWNASKQRVKSNNQTTADGEYSMNDLLDNLARECVRAYNTEIKNGIPAPATLKQYLADFFEKKQPGTQDKQTLLKLIERFISGEIKHRGADKANNTLRQYKSTYNHLVAFSKLKGNKVDFEYITLDFYYRFVDYLQAQGLVPNSIGKNIKNLKAFMNEAVDMGYTDNMQFKHRKFTVSKQESEAVYLTEKEIVKLYEHDFSANKRLEQVRDLFVFGCFTGLRFSDYSNVQPQNIVEMDGELYIRMLTQKTKERVIIPCNPMIRALFEKYGSSDNKLPRAPSNQKFNEYTKEAAELAGLKEKGRLTKDPLLPLAQCISSHTARRSFATNLYLSGFPTLDIMKVTGHRSETAFLNYIKVSKLDTAKRLSEHYKKGLGEKMKII